MNIQLSEHFGYKKLLKFTFPSMIMMVFTSIYGVVDGIFVSNFAGKTAFAAINLIMPYMMIFGTVGIMIGTGGTALIAKTLGEGKKQKANELFSMLVYVSIVGGAVLTVIAICFLRPVSIFLGAEGVMFEDCVTYGMYTLPAVVPFVLQNEFQCFCNAAEKPNLGLGLTIAAGVTNIVLDALFVGVFGWGLIGAAEILAGPLSKIFVGYDAELFAMTKWAFMIYSLSFLVCGFNIFGSSFFTALNNGLISAGISFLRTLVFQTAAVMILPIFFGLDGIWVSILVAEGIALGLTAFCIVKYRKQYHYW